MTTVVTRLENPQVQRRIHSQHLCKTTQSTQLQSAIPQMFRTERQAIQAAHFAQRKTFRWNPYMVRLPTLTKKKQQIVGKNKPYMDGMGLLMEITSCQLGC